MSLRPLIEIAAESERVHALASRVRAAAAGGGEAVSARVSAMLRPPLLAALLENDPGPARPPALPVSAHPRSPPDPAAHLPPYPSPRRGALLPPPGARP